MVKVSAVALVAIAKANNSMALQEQGSSVLKVRKKYILMSLECYALFTVFLTLI